MAFCPRCGKEVSPQTFYCPNCGNNLSQATPPAQPTESVSALYWLLPLFFAFLGGIVAYVVVKDRNPKEAGHLLIFGLVWTLAAAILAAALFYFAFGLFGGLTTSASSSTFTVTYTSVSP